VIPGQATVGELRGTLDPVRAGREMYALVEDLYPLCRSITGDGVRETLRRVAAHADLKMHEVPSGTPVFDWTVPREWNIRDAYVKNARGERVIDFKASSLHVVSYSVPVRTRLPLAELKPRVFTIPEHPDWTPYRTSYYRESWGFCAPDRVMAALPEGEYEVCIDSSLAPGSLSYGECYVRGATEDEVLISCHVCHPSLANDNLSGIAVAAFLAGLLATASLRYSYRLLFIPGTIGSISWLAANESTVARIRHGLVLACVGDGGAPTYKKSRRGDAEIDRAARLVLRERGGAHRIEEFTPYGYDERQFCSPGFDLPVGCLMRTPHGRFPEYHTSADNLDLVRPEALADSLQTCLAMLDVLESNRTYVNQNPKCEPQLGKRGLYGSVGGLANAAPDEMTMLWVLNLSDGRHSLLDITERSGCPFGAVKTAARALEGAGLLREA
jgi:aminopeptidase-like protein